MARRKKARIEPPTTRQEAHKVNNNLLASEYNFVKNTRPNPAERTPFYDMLRVTHEACMEMIDRLYDPARQVRQLTSEQIDRSNVKGGAG